MFALASTDFSALPVLWTFTPTSTAAKPLSAAAPAIAPDGGTIYVTGGSVFTTPSGTYGAVYAVDVTTASPTQKWVFPVTTTTALTGAAVVGADGVVYIDDNNGQLYALNPDGTQKWTAATAPCSPVGCVPSVAVDGTVYSGPTGPSNKLFAFQSDGSSKWTFTTPANVVGRTQAVGSDGTIYVTAASLLVAVTSSGTQKWTYGGLGTNSGNPSLGPDGTVYVVTSGGKVHAVAPAGSKIWIANLGLAGLSTPVVGSNSLVYVTGANDHNIYGVSVSTGTTVWSYNMGANSTDASSGPVIAPDHGGTLYVPLNDNTVRGMSTIPLKSR